MSFHDWRNHFAFLNTPTTPTSHGWIPSLVSCLSRVHPRISSTLYSEVAKKDSDIYDVAHDQIAAPEQAFETFLLEKRINPQTDPYRIANNLDKMCIANRFGPYTSVVRDFNDFIAKTISALQHNLEQWKDADTLTKEARQKCQKAIDALDALDQRK